MKTLKDILDEITPIPKRAFHDYAEIKESVRLWLEQKRQQYIDVLKMEDCNVEITPYDELLEELK